MVVFKKGQENEQLQCKIWVCNWCPNTVTSPLPTFIWEKLYKTSGVFNCGFSGISKGSEFSCSIVSPAFYLSNTFFGEENKHGLGTDCNLLQSNSQTNSRTLSAAAICCWQKAPTYYICDYLDNHKIQHIVWLCYNKPPLSDWQKHLCLHHIFISSLTGKTCLCHQWHTRILYPGFYPYTQECLTWL